MKTQALVIVGVGAVGLLAAAYIAKRIKDAGGLSQAASAATKATIGAAGDVGAGVVLGVGDSVGIPRTSQDQCDQDLASGRMWDASFSCDAGRFIRGATGGYVPQNVGGYRMEGRNYLREVSGSYGSGGAASEPLEYQAY